MNTKIGLLAATAFVLVAGHAAATPTFGSASESTYRDCSAVTAAEACDGTGTGQRIVTRVTTGGALSTANSDLTLAGQTALTPGGASVVLPNDGSFARSTVDFIAGLDLPVIRGSTYSVVGGQDRVNINSIGYQSYDYHGPDTAFSLTATLDIQNASGAAVGDPSGVLPGGSIFTAYVAIWDVSALGGFTSAQDIFDNVFLSPCGSTGVLAVGSNSGPLAAGASSQSVTTSLCPGLLGAPGQPGPNFTLHDGDEVLVVAGLQLPVNRGGFADASHTFTTALDTDHLTTAEIGNLEAGLQSGESLLAVPEPAAWAMMLMGFFGLGSALRRRQRVLAV